VSNTIPSPQETDEGNQTKHQFKKQSEFLNFISFFKRKEVLLKMLDQSDGNL